MKNRLIQFMAVVGMGVLTMTLDSQPALAAESCANGLVICTNMCPGQPNLLCQAYGCAGAGSYCETASCRGLDYAVNCSAA